MKKILVYALTAVTLLPTGSLFAQTNQSDKLNNDLNIPPIIESINHKSNVRTSGGGIVTANNVNFRKTAGLSGTIICQLDRGDILDEVGDSFVEKDGYYWYPASYNGRWGWIASDFFDETY